MTGARTAIAALLILASSSGCNAISGIDAYRVGELEAATETAGDALELEGDVPDTGTEIAPETLLEADSGPDTLEAATDTADTLEAADTCTHANGIGQNYTLCVPLGIPGNASTYTIEMAKAARAAWTTPGTDEESTCPIAGAPGYVARHNGSTCAVWVYSNGAGANVAGRVFFGPATSCGCPDLSSPTWE